MGELLMYAAYLYHEAWMESLFFLGETKEEAEAKAIDYMLKETEEFRDEDKFPEDDEWIDECFTNEWSIGSGEVKDA